TETEVPAPSEGQLWIRRRGHLRGWSYLSPRHRAWRCGGSSLAVLMIVVDVGLGCAPADDLCGHVASLVPTRRIVSLGRCAEEGVETGGTHDRRVEGCIGGVAGARHLDVPGRPPDQRDLG